MADFYLMSRRKTKTGNWRLTWERLGSERIWGWGLLWFSAAIFGIFTFLMDYLRTSNPSLLWFVTYWVSFGEVVVLALIFKASIKGVGSSRLKIFLNLFAAGVIGAIKNVTVGLMAITLGLETDIDFAFRVVGGFAMGTLLVLSFAATTAARTEHANAVRKLQSIQNELLGARENLEIVLAEELERLQENSREAVIPKLKQISSLISTDASSAHLIKELEETAKDRLRPLMDELSSKAKRALSKDFTEPQGVGRVLFPRSLDVGMSLRPLALSGYLLAIWSFLEYYFAGLEGYFNAHLAALVHLIVLIGLRALTRRFQSVDRVPGVIGLISIGFLALVPALFIVGLLPLSARLSVALPVILLVSGILSFTVFSYLFILDDERIKVEARITAENAELMKEQAIFEQKLWVFKRSWLFMLHGTVQAALTAALTRLQTFTDNDPYQASLIRADLERAEKALRTVPNTDVDFTAAVEELRSAWKGVCAIFVDVDLRAERALKVNPGTAYCVNEIVKEAIGNSVRHGGATGVQVTISREADDVLDIRIQNDGKPVVKKIKKGIGSRMLDDITIDWSLKSSGKLTTLTARLPI
ncbi:MAG: hypothetical protein RLZ71_440 [Actinomycetota bacterium]|jgi:hypothetical protein